MSIATQITALQTDKTNISNAITTMGGSVTSGDGFDNFAADILTIPQGGGGTEIQPKDVNFYDYDGKVLYAYTLAEAQALTALPELPEGPSGYVASSWTENLTFVKNLTYPFNIGVNYTTTKNGTEFDIVINDDKEVSCYVFQGKVDWGDGTSDSESGPVLVNHTYASSGNYTVTITGSNGPYLSGRTVDPYTHSISSTLTPPLMYTREFYNGYTNVITSSLVKRIRVGMILNSTAMFNYTSLESVLFACQITFLGRDMFNTSTLEHITIPSSVTSIGDYAFSHSSLKSFVLPTSITSIGGYAFEYCYSLEHVYLPSVTSLGYGTFSYCYSLKTIKAPLITTVNMYIFNYCRSLQSIDIPSGITDINMSAFGDCTSLLSVTIPSSVTYFSNYCFRRCRLLNEVKVLATTPPTLQSGVFDNNYSTRKIYVPYSADHSILNAYKTANNWSNYASYIEELPAS